jgi:peptidyl-prolyl cis-trans isomerase B (cyclophilin B)
MSARTRNIIIAVAVAVLAVLVAVYATQCTGEPQEAAESDQVEEQQEQAAEQSPPPAAEEEPVFTPTYEPNGDEVAVITTDKGVVKMTFYPEDAPLHVASFVELAQSGFYDGTTFHRVVPDFVAQGGDPYSKTGEGPPGTGGPGYTVPAEFNARQHLEGTLAMARSADPDSAGSQFYICLAPQPSLDGQYTVFGEVTEGMDVVRQLAVGDVISSLAIENATE